MAEKRPDRRHHGEFVGDVRYVKPSGGHIAGEVGKTPLQFNSGVSSMVKNLSETVIIPIAGLILAFVMTYELITMS